MIQQNNFDGIKKKLAKKSTKSEIYSLDSLGRVINN